MDHLFLDQDAVPTIIETKRSTDTRIRREVVGQMMDYAANAVVYWPVEKLIAAFETTCAARGAEPNGVLEDFLSGTMSADDFWKSVDANLETGRIRMVFVSDVIPPPLRRIVEFLNGQMKPAEVFALEVKQFTGQDMKTLVPRVIGATAEAEAKKRVATSSGIKWDDSSFLNAVSLGDQGLESVYRSLREWMASHQLKSYWGVGSIGSFGPYHPDDGKKYACVYLRTTGVVSVAFTFAKRAPGFEAEEQRRELARRFNQIADVKLPVDEVSGWKEFPMSLLTPPESMNQFLATLDWFFATVREAIARNKA